MKPASSQRQIPEITFVVLHYNTIEHTRACVASLLAQRSVALHIVLVDNGSTNGSDRLLEQEFAESPRITVLFQQPNIGYARGSNLGYRYARETLRSPYICLSNNDVVYADRHLARKACAIFAREDCDVLGPSIYVPANKYYQNPRWDEMLSVRDVDRILLRYRRRKWRLRLGFRNSIRATLRSLLGKSQPVVVPRSRSTTPPSTWNAQLHGASVFVGPRFIAGRENCFNPTTLFSCEMDILCLECAKAGYSLYYCDEIEVTHHAHGTIRQPGRKQRQADIAYLDHQIASMCFFRKLLKAETDEQAPASDPSGPQRLGAT